MKFSTVLIFAGFTVCLMAQIGCGDGTVRSTRPIFDSTSHAFRQAGNDTRTVRHVFKVTNPFDHPLELDTWKTDCGCTSVVLPDRPIPSGKSASIEVVIRYEQGQWKLRERAYIYFKGIAEPTVLTLFADIIAPLHCEPSSVDFGLVAPGAEKSVVLKFRNELQEPLTLDHIEADSLDVTLDKPVYPPATPGTATIRLKLDDKPGRQTRVVRIFFDHEQRLEVPITVQVSRDGFTINPDGLQFGVLHVGQSITRPLLIKVSAPDPGKWAIDLGPDVKASVVSVDESHAAEGHVQMTVQIIATKTGKLESIGRVSRGPVSLPVNVRGYVLP